MNKTCIVILAVLVIGCYSVPAERKVRQAYEHEAGPANQPEGPDPTLQRTSSESQTAYSPTDAPNSIDDNKEEYHYSNTSDSPTEEEKKEPNDSDIKNELQSAGSSDSSNESQSQSDKKEEKKGGGILGMFKSIWSAIKTIAKQWKEYKQVFHGLLRIFGAGGS